MKWGFPGDSVVKNLPAIQETQVKSLGQEDPLEKGMSNHFSILAWRIPWTEEPGGLQSIGSQNAEPVRRAYNITACSRMTGVHPKQKVPIAGLSGTAQTD